MKKIIVAITLLALAGAAVQTATAGDREWATVGKILTGVAAVSVIAHAVDHQPVSYAVSYSSCAPRPVVCAPAPVVYRPAPVIYVPAPVVYVPRPVYFAPRSCGNVGYAFGHGRGHRGHGRGW